MGRSAGACRGGPENYKNTTNLQKDQSALMGIKAKQ